MKTNLKHMQRTSLLCTALMLAFAAPSVAQPADTAANNEKVSRVQDRQAVSIAIYNDTLALVNEQRTLQLDAGENRIAMEGVSAQIRPETSNLSVMKGEPLLLLEQNFDFDLLTPDAMLNKAVGREIEVIRTHPTTGAESREKAIVLSNNQGVILKYADRIETGLEGRFAFTDIPQDLRERPTLSVQVYAKTAGQRDIQLSYLTSGFGWKADYVATLADDEKTLDLAGWVTLSNQSATRFENVQLQLVAGEVNQVTQQMTSHAPMMLKAAADMSPEAPLQEESLFEYHLYTLDRLTTLNNNQTKQVSLLSAYQVPVKKQYLFEGSGRQYFFERYTHTDNIKAKTYLHFENKKEQQLGMPLPKGVVRVYKQDSRGQALFVGEDRIAHIAKNEKFKVYLGEAFDVSMQRTQTDFKKIGFNASESTHQVVFNNAKDSEVTVQFVDMFYNDWKIISSNIAHHKQDASTEAWQLHIPAGGQAKLEYTVSVAW